VGAAKQYLESMDSLARAERDALAEAGNMLKFGFLSPASKENFKADIVSEARRIVEQLACLAAKEHCPSVNRAAASDSSHVVRFVPDFSVGCQVRPFQRMGPPSRGSF